MRVARVEDSSLGSNYIYCNYYVGVALSVIVPIIFTPIMAVRLDGPKECCAIQPTPGYDYREASIWQPVDCASTKEGVVNVSNRFKFFSLLVIIINLIHLIPTVIAICGHCKRNENLLKMGNVLKMIMFLTTIVVYVLGTIARFSFSGRICSGDRLSPDIRNAMMDYDWKQQSHDLNPYLTLEGRFIYVFLFAVYIYWAIMALIHIVYGCIFLYGRESCLGPPRVDADIM